MESIFMIDCARKYYTPQWIKKLIKEIADVGYTAISLHFSEDSGMRLESKTYPYLAGGDHTLCLFGKEKGIKEDDDKYITQDEMASIVKYAHSLGVKVIPSLDSPGHMNYVVKKFNAYNNCDIGNYFHKNGKVLIVQGSSMVNEKEQLNYSRGIDITNPQAIEFVKNLYTEFGKFFLDLGCDTFDIGGDELLGFGETIDDSYSKWNNLDHWQQHAITLTGNPDAVAYDAFILYMNDICSLLKSMGYKSIRMWNDDVYRDFDTSWKCATSLDKSIEIQYWAPFANNGKNNVLVYLNKGHNVYNFVHYFTYYILGFGFKSKVTPQQILDTWDAYYFDRDNKDNNPAYNEPNVKGGGFCLWSDCPSYQTEDEILESMRPYFTAIAQKLKDK
jgi:hexosaminidase